jgi:putative FmdB family regulatory protein
VPTYQYACTDAACSHRFDTVQSVSDEALTVCPQCGGRLRKVFSAVGVVFKGSGFYRTDSRSNANGKAAASKTAATESTSASSSSTSSSSTSSSSGTSGSAAAAASSAGSGSTSSTKAAAS